MKKWTFTHELADDEGTDPQWTLDQSPRFTIQDARAYGGGLVVVEHSPDTEEAFWVKHHGTHTTIGHAMAECARRAEDGTIASAPPTDDREYDWRNG